jgi:hypothetical protein
MSDNINPCAYFYLKQTYRHWVCCPLIKDTLFADEHGPHMGWMNSNLLSIAGIHEMAWRTDIKLEMILS